MLRLGVNIDHVATVRNARGTPWPDPLRAALLAQEAGADGIITDYPSRLRAVESEFGMPLPKAYR